MIPKTTDLFLCFRNSLKSLKRLFMDKYKSTLMIIRFSIDTNLAFAPDLTYLSYLSDKILQGFETGMFFTGMILIDLQKAFDTIDHKIFLDKIACLGFSDSAILWSKSYLQDRSFSVNIGKEYSNPGNLSCGIPRGQFLAHSYSSFT